MTGIYGRFADIPQLTRSGSYGIDVPWRSVENTLATFGEGFGLDLDPDFQRGHVWSVAQQERYVEFVLRGGRTGREILFNQSGWGKSTVGRGEPVVLVDGKQRLQAVRRFLNGEIEAFGRLYGDFADTLPMTGPQFRFVVNDLATRKEVLQWYVDLNAGGTVHADEEIDRVRDLIAAETR